MSFSIQTNVNSMVAQENLRVNSDFQSRTIQRLTSGYRINSSSDDAAGLAVATSYWLLGITVGLLTVVILFVADSFPDAVREEKQEPSGRARG